MKRELFLIILGIFIANFPFAEETVNLSTKNFKEITFPVYSPSHTNYKVKKGDCLSQIASRFKTSVKELKKINNLKRDTIIIEQVLKIPSSKKETKKLFIEYFNDTNFIEEGIDTRALEIVEISKQFLGVPYGRGGESLKRVDCSGFIKLLFKSFDIFLPHSSRAQFSCGKEVKRVTIGDLLFFTSRRSSQINHVGLYIGNGKFIHASSYDGKVVISELDSYYQQVLRGARRIL